MKKKWFTTAELLGMAGLPKTRQGVNKRAREDGWEKRRHKGVQWRDVEYSLYSLPELVQHSLSLQETPSSYAVRQADMLAVWIQIYQQFYQQCSEQEREALVAHILRYGMASVLSQLRISSSDDAAPDDPSAT
ncbi:MULTISPECIES: DNA-binding protein [Symbiopectobacterium]|uniref:DNA-binding protein n=1 Tax=Symbiopectobacterium TaxID=801 RepID=UPI001A1EB479|nr:MULTISPECIES: DNA-binding protein [Symbiopectobacterium]MBG6247040.1 putative DNA-binding transcriptional regulator [Candidatus Symbiopectobacterium sp. PLON1]MBT9428420.1 putative DNA-binding transcriptional regulator [Candidatus Symbiopectobacterium endolongispinus]